MAKKPGSIDEYLSLISDEKVAALQKLRKTIRAALPKAQECISLSATAPHAAHSGRPHPRGTLAPDRGMPQARTLPKWRKFRLNRGITVRRAALLQEPRN